MILEYTSKTYSLQVHIDDTIINVNDIPSNKYIACTSTVYIIDTLYIAIFTFYKRKKKKQKKKSTNTPPPKKKLTPKQKLYIYDKLCFTIGNYSFQLS